VKGPRILASRFASLTSFTLVLAALIGGALADAQSQPAADGPHLLVVPATPEGEAALARTDARVVAGYESFSLVEATGADDERLLRAGADRRDDMRTVSTAAGTIDPRSARRSLAAKGAPERDEVLTLVQFVGPPKDAWLERLAATGAAIVGYQPENGYVVHARGDEVDRVAALLGTYAPVRAVAVLTAADKLEAERSSSGRYAVQTVAGDAGAAARAEAARSGPSVARAVALDSLHTQYLELTAAEAAGLARDPAVVAVEPYAEPRPSDERAAQLVAGNLAGFAPSGPGYLGWLVNPARIPSQASFDFAVDVTDGGLDAGIASPPAHPDFRVQGAGATRVAYMHNYTLDANARDCEGHGTNVASIAAGYNADAGAPLKEDSAGFNHGLGVAPFALVGASKIFDCSGAFASFVPGTLAEAAYVGSARISNNSWGTSGLTSWGDYTARSQQYDGLVRDVRGSVPGDQPMVEVFAAGNDGVGHAGDGLPDPDEGYGTIMAEATAKNVITVGAAEGVRASGTDGCGVSNSGANSARDIIDFSSRGPTDDGRLKPDLVAPGTHVTGAAPQHGGYSGTGTCTPAFGGALYSLVSGTSQAAPQVSGAAALLRHWYRRTELADPSPAMTKALLVNTATDLAGGDSGQGTTIAAGPNTDQGWGRVNLGTAFESTARAYHDQVDAFDSSGQSVRRAYRSQSAAKPVRVTLAWTDAPGSTVGDAWVNNLDLEVQAGGHRYLGNVFAGALSHTGGSPDTRNNVESVYLPAGAADRFTVTVTGTQISGNGVPNSGDGTDQDFALVVSNAAEQDAPVLVHDATTVADPGPGGDGDAVLESDEQVELTEAVRNVGTDPAGGLTATLSAGGGLTVTQDGSGYGPLAVDATDTNAVPFEAELSNQAACGVDVPATLDVTTTTPAVETQRIPLTLATGEPGSAELHNASGLPMAVPDNDGAGASSSVFVAERGRIKDLDVRLPGSAGTPAIDHDFLGDVVIDLIGPDGTTVRLAEHPGGPDNSGKDFVNVVFDDEAALRLGSPTDANPAQRPPYNGTFKPQNDQLARFDGKSRRGTWTLRVRDRFESDSGTLNAWGLTTRKAVCDFDSTPPNTSLTATPPSLSNDTTPSFAFSSPESGVSFECRLDAAQYEPCTSPKAYSAVGGGSHTFRVRAIDGSDNEDPTPATYTWTVDTAPPETTIGSGPAQGSFTQSGNAAFGFSSEPQATFQCSLDSAPFTSCSDPQPQSYASLGEGQHTFRVRAVDLAGNADPTPAARTWTVDRTGPAPGVSSPSRTQDSTPTLSGPAGTAPGDAGTVTVRVYRGTGTTLLHTLSSSVSGGRWSVEVPAPLGLGRHTVRVTQADAAGNSGASALVPFDVVTDAVAPSVSISAPAHGSSTEDTTPAVTGRAGLAEGDDGTVTLKLWNGTLAAGLPAQTLVLPRDARTGAWAAELRKLDPGTYTLRAEQSDSALPTVNVGTSSLVTFTVTRPAPAFVLAPAEERLVDVLSGRYTVIAACAAACEVTARLSVGSAAIGSGIKRLRGAGAAAVRVRLSGTARAALSRRSSARPTLSVTVVDGARRLTLRRKVALHRSPGIARFVRAGLRLWTVCSERCPLSAKLTLSAVAARKLGLKPKRGAVRFGIGSGRATGGTAAKRLAVKAPRRARRALTKASRLKGRLEVTAGRAGSPQRSVRRTLKLRR
jgi:subtilisin-like proprotein convertase family protein